MKSENLGFPFQYLNRVFLAETNYSLIVHINHFKKWASVTSTAHSEMMILDPQAARGTLAPLQPPDILTTSLITVNDTDFYRNTFHITHDFGVRFTSMT